MSNKYSLFIGRFQGLHEGHIKLIQTVLDEGKNVCVALRDTGINDKNPYTVEQRIKMFTDKLPSVKIIVIPDIEEVCYGRDVGWGIREIRLDKETESISATKIRNNNIT
ncbi:adenylyltransferase/cytidyltransferase family protein [Candidatus Dojkabacteria bacterium]|jgi:cytidyltransferase-like protein|nr:adenylyltransferase/cytidyltransferase family protein [Candidatus Dojkabacteria bacterium]